LGWPDGPYHQVGKMEMTDLESRVLEAWAAEMPGVRPETHLDLIREFMK
jgi:hypothetical protein